MCAALFSTRSSRWLLVGLGAVAFQLPTELPAQTLVWDSVGNAEGAQDGAGLWNLSLSNWWLDGVGNRAWSNSVPYLSARFGSGNGVGGTVTLENDIELQNLIFEAASSGNYLLNTSNNSRLRFQPNSVVTANSNATLQLQIDAQAGWTKQGAQTLTLSGSTHNLFAGSVSLQAGTVILSKTAGINALAQTVTVGTNAVLNWGRSHQLDDNTDLIIDGGTIALNNQSETFRSYTQKAGGQTGNSNGNILITGEMRLEGGNSYTVNSGGNVTVGSANFTGMSSGINTILLGAVNTSTVTSFNIGSGGLTLSGQVLRLNVATDSTHRGSRLSLHGDLKASGTNSILTEDVAPKAGAGISELDLGSAIRSLDIVSGTTTLSRHLHVTGTAGFDKKGSGTLVLSTTANTDLIKVPLIKVSEGILRLANNEQIAATSDVLLVGGRFEANGKTESFNKLTLNGGEFDTGLSAVINVQDLQGNSSGKMTLTSGATLKTTQANLAGTNFILGSNSSPQVTRFHVQGGLLNLANQRLTFYRPTSAGVGGNEVLLEGNLTASGNSSLGFDNVGSIISGAVSQLRVEGTQRQILTSTTSDVLAIGVVFAGSGTWTKMGEGTLTLNGDNFNTFSGTSILNAGILNLGKTQQVDALAGTLKVEGGTLNFTNHHQLHDAVIVQQTGGVINFNNRNESFTDLLRTSGEMRNTSGQITVTGTLKGIDGTSNNSGSTSAIYTLNSGGVTTVGTADFSESTKRFAILIGGNSTALTRFVVGAGGLKLKDNDITLNRDNAGAEFELQGDVTATGTNNFTQGSLGASGTRLAQIQHGTSSRTWNIVSGQTVSALPIVSTGGGLTKTGAGTLQLNAINTYSGKTHIQSGTLTLGASANLTQSSWIELGAGAQFHVAAMSSGFTLNQSANALLSGAGIVVGNLNLGQGASLRPGLSSNSTLASTAGALAGKLTIQGHLTATQSAANTVAVFNLSAANLGDQLSILGDLKLNQHSNLQVRFDLGFQNAQVGDTWTLMDWTGNFTNQGFQAGSLSRTGDDALLNEGNLDLPTLQTGWYWQISDMQLTRALQISIVPEPSHLSLAWLSCAVLVMIRRRKTT